MHTFYITGGTAKDRLTYIARVYNELHIDLYDIHRLIPKEQSSSIGISDVREWQKKLLLAPLSSPYTIGIIPNAELLTTEAQNALLKTLEEPPTHTNIYIESQTSSSLLPTILSRCQMIQLPTHSMTSYDFSIIQLCDDRIPIEKKMAILDEQISNKEEAKVWIVQAIHTLHTHRKTLSTATYVCFMQHLLTASQHISSNVSYKLAIDHIFLIQ